MYGVLLSSEPFSLKNSHNHQNKPYISPFLEMIEQVLVQAYTVGAGSWKGGGKRKDGKTKDRNDG